MILMEDHWQRLSGTSEDNDKKFDQQLVCSIGGCTEEICGFYGIGST